MKKPTKQVKKIDNRIAYDQAVGAMLAKGTKPFRCNAKLLTTKQVWKKVADLKPNIKQKKIDKLDLQLKARLTNDKELAFWTLLRWANVQEKINEIIDRLNHEKTT